MDELLHGMKSAAEQTRLRVLCLCAHAELTVSDLVRILGQSQPRVSRHLRLLVEAGLLERYQEGNWAWYRLAENTRNADLARLLIDLIPADDPIQALDLERLEEIRVERARKAEEYFRRNAADWSEVRALHVDPELVDQALRKMLLRRNVTQLLDIGTGTGRVLELIAEDVDSAVGVDLSREMLSVARSNIDRAQLRNCQIRHADMYQLPFSGDRFDAVTMHMVLHYSDSPARALGEAARVLGPGGQLIVVDFAPHTMESMLEEHAHRWLGFDDEEMQGWANELNLTVGEAIRLEGAPLTVCLWPLERPANDQVSAKSKPAPRARRKA